MKTVFLAAPLSAAALSILMLATPAQAGAVGNACVKAGRANNQELCSCIQHVADMTLSSSDQRRAAKFFRDPNEAQVVRQSSSPSDNDFWARYKNFAATAEGFCG